MPAPAVLYVPGHWMENGKLEPDIQICCANLAAQGFVVLVYDPLGQGERLGNWLDHGHLEPLLVGISQAGLMVWESIRAVDYLISRPEVDPGKVGMVGSSGGGLNTLYSCAIDDRILVSVPVCFVTTFLSAMTAERDLNWEDGVDLCNQVPGVMAYAEMSDLCALFAPKPLCVIAARFDRMFPIEGTRQVHQEVAQMYQLFGVPERTKLVTVEAEHGFCQPMREAAYGWFLRWLQEEGDGEAIPEQHHELLPVPFPQALTYIAPPRRNDLETLRQRQSYQMDTSALCFPVAKGPLPGPAITALTAEIAEQSPPSVGFPSNQEAWCKQREELVKRACKLLGSDPAISPLEVRIFNQVLHENLFVERLVYSPEPGIHIPAIFLAPVEWKQHIPVVLYLDEWGKEAGLVIGVLEGLLERKMAVLAIDVRGVGETDVSDFEATTNALMTDRPLFGQRVWDVRRAVDCLWERVFVGIQIDKGRIACLGRGWGGSWLCTRV